jgi:hypothetical protein
MIAGESVWEKNGQINPNVTTRQFEATPKILSISKTDDELKSSKPTSRPAGV